MRSKITLLMKTTTAVAVGATTSSTTFNNLIAGATAFQFQSSATSARTTSSTIKNPGRQQRKLLQQQNQQNYDRYYSTTSTTSSLFSSNKFSLFGSVKDGYYDNINNDEIGFDKLLQKATSVRSKWKRTTTPTSHSSPSSSPSPSSSSSLSFLLKNTGGSNDYKSNLFFSSSYDASEKTTRDNIECDNKKENKKNKSIRGFSNWIIPGKIMVGQYPGTVPEQTTPTIEETREHIRNILFAPSSFHAESNNNNQNNNYNNSNTTICFVSLQSELPPQDDKETWNRNNGKIYLKNDDDDDLKSSTSSRQQQEWPNPFSHYLPEIESVMMSQNNDYDNESDRAVTEQITRPRPPLPQVQYIHHPIEDLSVPSNSKDLRLLFWKILNILDSNHENMVYIHCWGGRGRAGLTACCLLTLLAFADKNNYSTITDDDTVVVNDDGGTVLNVAMIFDIVQEGYDSRLGSCDMPIGLQKSPQTESQRIFVRKFFEQVSNTQSSKQVSKLRENIRE
jgi:protein-tyrosine phosphatase